MNLSSILPARSKNRLHMGCFLQASRQTQQHSKVHLAHLTRLQPSNLLRDWPQLGQGLELVLNQLKKPVAVVSILAHFSCHFSHRVQPTGACPCMALHSQQKKWPLPQSTEWEILILSLTWHRCLSTSGTKLTTLAQPGHVLLLLLTWTELFCCFCCWDLSAAAASFVVVVVLPKYFSITKIGTDTLQSDAGQEIWKKLQMKDGPPFFIKGASNRLTRTDVLPNSLSR